MQSLLKNFFDHCQDVLVIIDSDNRIVDINPMAEKVLAVRRVDIKGESFLGLVHLDDRSNCKNHLTNCTTESKDMMKFECRIAGTDVKGLWLDWRISGMEDGHRCLSAREFSYHKVNEEVLEKLEETGKIGYWSVRLEEMIPRWSAGTYDIHGIERGEKVPLENAIDFYQGESKEHINQDFGDCTQKGIPFDRVYQFKDAKGTLKWVRSCGNPRFDEAGNITEVYGVFQDVTNSTNSQLELESLNDRLRLALDASGIGVWEWRLKENHLWWDSHMYRLYGIHPERFSGAYDAWQAGLHPDDKAAAEAAIQLALDGSKPFDCEFRVRWPSGDIRHIRAIATVHRNQNGDATKMIGVNWDISDAKTQESKLKLAKEKALQANNAKSQFLSNMAHEIRTPMNGLLGFLELLQETNMDEEQKSYLSTASNSGRSLLLLLNDILDYSKIEAGQLDFNVEPCNISSLVLDQIQLFEAISKEKNVNIKLNSKIEENQSFKLDSLRIKQILSNLIGNAVKFTDKGTIDVDLSYSSSENLKFMIKDEGIGIPQDRVGNIFKPFEQSEKDTTRQFGGTGLGLSIVHKLVTLMGGRVHCDSKVGVGSTFVVEIPSLMTESPNIDKIETSNATIKQESSFELRVLVVEDNPINAKLVMTRLAKFGIDAELASNGQEAVDIIKESQYDLILMDINMPIMNGYEATEIIRRIDYIIQPQIYALTANAFEEDKKLANDSGMDGHIVKPFRRKDILRILTKVSEKLQLAS